MLLLHFFPPSSPQYRPLQIHQPLLYNTIIVSNNDLTSYGKITVEPSVPKTTPICLNVQLKATGSRTSRARLDTQIGGVRVGAKDFETPRLLGAGIEFTTDYEGNHGRTKDGVSLRVEDG